MIEDALRETFAAKAGEAPAAGSGDQAQRFTQFAMARARQIRHRRMVGTALAGVLIIAMVGLMTIQLVTGSRPAGRSMADAKTTPSGGSPAVLPVPSKAERPETDTSAMPAEVASGGEIYTENKSRVQLKLPDDAQASSVYKASDGYLVVAALRDDAEQLLLLDKGGNKKVLIPSAVRIVISPSGSQVAWLAGGLISVAARRSDRPALDQARSIAAPALAVPVAFLGVDVVLARTKPDGTGTDGFDLWYPARTGDYAPAWDSTVLRIFGSRSDGGGVYAETPDPDDTDAACVALLVADQPFKVTGQACGLPKPAPGDDGGISADGRWLAYPIGDTARIAVLDLSVSFAKKWTARLYELDSKCVRTYWLTRTFVADTGTKFISIDPTEPSEVETAQGTSEGKVLIEPLRS
jgi:hypothetical protein